MLRAAGARVTTVPVDRDGLDPAALPARARLLFVTPSHQYPTGAILPLSRRQALLQWAERAGALIVEDDYDGEFRYDGRRLESLQGLDRRGRVLYVGTFSRTIFSALRIGYVIVPPALVAAFTAAKWLCESPHGDARAGDARRVHRQRPLRAAPAAARAGAAPSRARRCSTRCGVTPGDRVEVTGDGAGAHVVLWLGDRSEAAVVTAAAARGVGVYGIAPVPTRGARRGRASSWAIRGCASPTSARA